MRMSFTCYVARRTRNLGYIATQKASNMGSVQVQAMVPENRAQLIDKSALETVFQHFMKRKSKNGPPLEKLIELGYGAK